MPTLELAHHTDGSLKADHSNRLLLTIFIVFLINLYPNTAQERHLSNIRQLTFGGDNAEAYFSFDGSRLSFQSNNRSWGLHCDQIFAMDIQSAEADTSYRPPMISNGKGRTTCAYYMPDNKHVLYASTYEAGDQCPSEPEPRADKKYVWPVYSSYDIYVSDLDGNIVNKLTDSPGYDAEATISPDGSKIVFTSDRSGDLELWTMNVDGSNQRQITFGLGYDGGAFFSPDSKRLVFRSSRPSTDSERLEYLDLLRQGLVAPTEMEIYTCNTDGSDLRQVTHLGKANWAPFFHPGGTKIIFSSNHASKRGYDFQLYLINTDGTGLEQVTTESIFNAFPMFSPNGKFLSWSSNRLNGGTRATNVFIAEWKD
ncbi:MAG: PD40 domain-containing protein [Ignavibacteria bacterium]|nr:PD40 domain-containing protein [Ignavibacteria bacterium]